MSLKNKHTKVEDLIDWNAIEAGVKASVSTLTSRGKQTLDESYVAEPKPFRQVSELVSSKTKDSHTELYKRTIDILNKVSAELDTAPRGEADSRHSEYRSLKFDETYNLNSVWLHELYFANCFDPHSEIAMDSLAYLKLQRDFGDFESWQKDFIACALAAGDGWVVTGYHMFLKRYVNAIVSNNSQDVLVGVYPVLVVDMHEHAYFRDYLTDKKSYVIAQMREINWTVVGERLKRSEGIHEVLK